MIPWPYIAVAVWLICGLAIALILGRALRGIDESCPPLRRERFVAPRESDCEHGCCEAGDEGLWSEAVPR